MSFEANTFRQHTRVSFRVDVRTIIFVAMIAGSNAELVSIYDRCGTLQRDSTNMIIFATLKTTIFKEMSSQWFERMLEVAAENDRLRLSCVTKQILKVPHLTVYGIFICHVSYFFYCRKLEAYHREEL